jgi:hypothetical protein
MADFTKQTFILPTEEYVLKRNREITRQYAEIYSSEPLLFKWAGMAAFASFHIGKKLKLWDWEESGIKTFSATCAKKNRTIEDDFQVIRIINNKIFAELGWVHISFSQMDFTSFQALLIEKEKHPIIIKAFEKLNTARSRLKTEVYSEEINTIIWKANTEILWHEQAKVVQPMFDKLSDLFSRAMTFFASFDYTINHHSTKSTARSRFMFFMMFNGFRIVYDTGVLPELTHLQHRWFWIAKDILPKWKKIESNKERMTAEIDLLTHQKME